MKKVLKAIKKEIVKIACNHHYNAVDATIEQAVGGEKYIVAKCIKCGELIITDAKAKETLSKPINIKDILHLENCDNVSDGYHTFKELYHHRMLLTASLFNTSDLAWKSKKHDDGTMFDDYFIVGITTNEGQATYHYHIDNWHLFNVAELESAPKWDGHDAETSIKRIYNYFKK